MVDSDKKDCCSTESVEKTSEACCNNASADDTAQDVAASCCEASTENKNTNDSNCCAEEASDCCSDSEYSCEDDPYAGSSKDAIVDFLFLDLSVCDRCQGSDERVFKAIEICRPVLASCGYNLVLNQIEIDNAQLAEHYRFYSSPTIRVNGVDVCTSVEENDCDCCREISDFDVKCRIFPFNGTYYEVPPTDMLVAHIIDTVIKGKSAEPDENPYVLPENLRGFFEGKERKAQEEKSATNTTGIADTTDATGAKDETETTGTADKTNDSESSSRAACCC